MHSENLKGAENRGKKDKKRRKGRLSSTKEEEVQTNKVNYFDFTTLLHFWFFEFPFLEAREYYFNYLIVLNLPILT